MTLQSYFAALSLTILFEWVIYLILSRLNFLNGKPKKLFLWAIIINTATNPLVNYFGHLNYPVISNIWFLEIVIAFGAEVFLIKYLMKVNYSKAALTSYTANLTTYMLGLTPPIILLFRLIG
jgi:hypothetical protein